MLSRRLFVALSLPTVAALALTSIAPAVGGEPPKAGADEERFLALINQERRSRRLPALRPDPVLLAMARAHSREMAEKDYFSHASPTPGLRDLMDRYRAACRRAGQGDRRAALLLVGENLYYSSVPDAARGHRSLMESEKHRNNILDGRYEAAGIGSYTSASGEYWVTQVFLKRRDG